MLFICNGKIRMIICSYSNFRQRPNPNLIIKSKTKPKGGEKLRYRSWACMWECADGKWVLVIVIIVVIAIVDANISGCRKIFLTKFSQNVDGNTIFIYRSLNHSSLYFSSTFPDRDDLVTFLGPFFGSKI